MRGLLGAIISGLFLGACTSSVQNVTTVKMDDTSLVVVEEEKVTEKKTVKLSELIDDFQIIRFENKDEAFFKSQWMYFSDNYICKPGILKEKLEEIVSSEDCTDDQKEKLKNFMQTLNENDNNVLFLGKLKNKEECL